MSVIPKSKVAKLTEDIVESLPKEKSKLDVAYGKKIASLVQLLSPISVIQTPTNVIPIYPIEGKLNREQVEDWIMQITKKHFKLT